MVCRYCGLWQVWHVYGNKFRGLKQEIYEGFILKLYFDTLVTKIKKI